MHRHTHTEDCYRFLRAHREKTLLLLFLEVAEVLYGSPHAIFQRHHGNVAQVLLGSLAAVVVVGSRQSNPHGGEGGAEGHQGRQEEHQQVEEEGEEVDQCVGEVAGGRLVAHAGQDLSHKLPERNGGVICDVVCLWLCVCVCVCVCV